MGKEKNWGSLSSRIGKEGSGRLDLFGTAEWGAQRILEMAKQKISSRRFFSRSQALAREAEIFSRFEARPLSELERA